MNIALKSSKIYLNYFIVLLLKQRVNNLRLIIVDDKLKAILNFAFFKTLKQLEIYLDKIDYLRQYVAYYAQKTQILQDKKTKLLQNAFSKENFRQQHSRKTIVDNSSNAKINLFNQFQSTFNRSIFLIHFEKIKILYINVNTLKKREFEVIMYYIKIERKLSATFSTRNEIEFIMFFNKMLFFVESKY